jgi:hypothetical protein
MVGLIALAATSAQAQRGAPVVPEHKVEIIPIGGYVWTWSRSVSSLQGTGKIDIKSSGFWGVYVDFNVQPQWQLSLLYRRQDSELTFKNAIGVTEKLSDMAVEYIHIGGVTGMTFGQVRGFTTVTIGATRFSFGDPVDSNVPKADDDWKFSAIIGLGAKYYINDRIGLRGQVSLPVSFMGGGVGIGTGGVTVGGYGITQTDLLAGLIIML